MNEALNRIRPALADWCRRRMSDDLLSFVSPDDLANYVVDLLRGQSPRTLSSLQAAAHLAVFRTLLAAERGELPLTARQTA